MYKRLLTIAIMIILALGTSEITNAQSLKGIGNKLKQGVENKAKNEVRKAENKTENKIKNKVNETVSDTPNNNNNTSNAASNNDNDVKPSSSNTSVADENVSEQETEEEFKPSADAIANDPEASSDVIDEGFTLTHAQMRASFEIFCNDVKDNKGNPLFPYKPYYKYPYFYALSDGICDVVFKHAYKATFDLQWTVPEGQAAPLENYQKIDFEGKESYVPFPEMALNMYYMAFLSDVTSPKAYLYLVRANSLFMVFMVGHVEFTTSNKQSYRFSTDDNLLLHENYDEWYARMFNIDQIASAVAGEYTPKEIKYNVAAALIDSVKVAEGKGNFADASRHRDEAMQAIELLKADKEFGTKEDKVLVEKFDDIAKKTVDYQRGAMAELGPEQPMPKDGMNDAALNASILKVAKAQNLKENIVKVVVSSTSWQIERDNFGNIARRRVNAYVVYKENGATFAAPYSFAQQYQGGGKYGATQFYGVGMGVIKVKAN